MIALEKLDLGEIGEKERVEKCETKENNDVKVEGETTLQEGQFCQLDLDV